MKSLMPAFKVEWLENERDEPTLIVNVLANVNEEPLFSDYFIRHWPCSFLSAIGISEFETEQHADFTLTRFIFNDIMHLLTIDSLSESIWITALSNSKDVLLKLQQHIRRFSIE